MRFALGLLGGALSALIIILAALMFGHNALRVLAGIGAVAAGPDCAAGTLTGALVIILGGAFLGGMFTSGMCGRIATGPAIGVGLVYGMFMWLFIEFLLLPVITDRATFPVASSAVAIASAFFGMLMGVWVIVAAHIWPIMAAKCEQ